MSPFEVKMIASNSSADGCLYNADNLLADNIVVIRFRQFFRRLAEAPLKL